MLPSNPSKMSFATIFSLLISLSGHLPLEVSGRVINAQTGEGIPYVNIGFLEKGIGTISNEAGFFVLSVPDELKGDTLHFSSLGYNKRKMVISEASKLTVTMEPYVVQLNEVTVKGVKTKQVRFGSNTEAKFLRSGLGTGDLGGEIGTKINIPKRGIILDSLNFFLISNTLDTVLLRLNIYPVKGEFPKASLLSNNVIITVTGRRKGWIHKDLSSLNIELETDFIATLELIGHSKNKGAIYFSQSPPYLAPMYYRNKSLDNVKKYKGGPMGIYFVGSVSVRKKP
jgi:hypothetical protein